MGLDSSDIEHIWIARPVRPAMALYVTGVFLAFMVLALFVFGSMEAVTALAAAGLATVASLMPGILTRVQYRVTDSGLGKRAFHPRRPGEFKELFSWDELSYVIPTPTGFKFYQTVDSSSPFRRFMKLHILAGRSGEFHVAGQDLEVVRGILEKRGVLMSRPPGSGRLEGKTRM